MDIRLFALVYCAALQQTAALGYHGCKAPKAPVKVEVSVIFHPQIPLQHQIHFAICLVQLLILEGVLNEFSLAC